MSEDARQDANQDVTPTRGQRRKRSAASANGDMPPSRDVSPQPSDITPTAEQVAFNPSWRIFRIMSEFVDGFTFLSHIRHSVTFFGSARLPEESPYYHMARELARRLAELGYTIVTGGGPGIMEAANQGATEAGGDSVGINIQLPHEQRINPYVKRSISFHFFFSRKVMLDYSAEAYIFFPGGFGTLDEFFELVTLIQTGKVDNAVPILLIGTDFWQGLCDWMERELLGRLQTIAPADLRIWTLTDDLDHAVDVVRHGIQTQVEQRIAETGTAMKTAGEKLKEATRPMAGTEQ